MRSAEGCTKVLAKTIQINREKSTDQCTVQWIFTPFWACCNTHFWFGYIDVTLFVFTVEKPSYHSKHSGAHIGVEGDVNRMILLVIPMRISCSPAMGAKSMLINVNHINCIWMFNTHSGEAMNVPSNLYLYVIIAGIKCDITSANAKTGFVHFVNFQIIIWIMVPTMTNWKSAAKYQACCIHYVDQRRLLNTCICHKSF